MNFFRSPEKVLLVAAVVFSVWLQACTGEDLEVRSPDEATVLKVAVENGTVKYAIYHRDTLVLDPSAAGVVMEDSDFSRGLRLTSVSPSKEVVDNFSMLHGKRTACRYLANEKVFRFENENNLPMEVIFRVSNDGVAFRYSFPTESDGVKTIKQEKTSFRFPEGATAFLQPMSEAKTGWSKVNPCYEEFYEREIPVGTPSPTKAGWVFPALFHVGSRWILITETGLGRNYCASRLMPQSPNGEYSIGFPEPLENFPGGGVMPQSTLPWQTPWRVLTIGSLATIVESDLGVALADKAIDMDLGFVKPGHAAWSWALLKDDSTIFDVQKKFIDYASEMDWEYCLVDADWDRKIGYDKARDLVKYASARNVGVILWYNSAGSWNETPYTPKNKLVSRNDRLKEFALLSEMGVKGVKIDFFGGDGQSMIAYYLDILEDAAKHKLLVNFHGATIPRGWHRTYPHLMSMEAVKGFEYVTFEQKNADEQPAHCTILPFTRNAFDPMDFTPVSLDSVPRIHRRTTAGFELALSVLFLSGIQHFVEIPRTMRQAPADVREFLRTLPTHWDDTKFVAGYPGRDLVIARKYGDRWFIAGINGENTPKTMKLDVSFLDGKSVSVLTDTSGQAGIPLARTPLGATGSSLTVTVRPHGGFVAVTD